MTKPAHKHIVHDVTPAEESAATQQEAAAGMQPARTPAQGNEASRSWMDYDHNNAGPTINDNEHISISALIAYVAHMNKDNEFRVERQFADRFNIPNVKCLPSERYDDAIRYLVDRVPVTPTDTAGVVAETVN